MRVYWKNRSLIFIGWQTIKYNDTIAVRPYSGAESASGGIALIVGGSATQIGSERGSGSVKKSKTILAKKQRGRPTDSRTGAEKSSLAALQKNSIKKRATRKLLFSKINRSIYWNTSSLMPVFTSTLWSFKSIVCGPALCLIWFGYFKPPAPGL